MTDRLLPATWVPAHSAAAVAALARELTAGGVDVVADQPLGRWTTLGVGGTARAFVDVVDETQLAAVLLALGRYPESDVPLLVLGRGSNLLIADSGWPSLAVRLGAGFKWQSRDGDDVSAGGGLAMPALAAWAAEQSLAGLEFAAGIPATVGGSVRMNAGAHGTQTADHLLSARIASVAEPKGADVATETLHFAYRHSELPARSVVTAARWRLRPDDPAAIRERLDELRAWRRQTQPLRQRNCGSVFTNPPGDSAGRLVDAAGLKGRRVGGAAVSDKHANFIVVDPGCRARDVWLLIGEVRAAVVAAGGPLLEPEVRVIGEFGAADGT